MKKGQIFKPKELSNVGFKRLIVKHKKSLDFKKIYKVTVYRFYPFTYVIMQIFSVVINILFIN